MGRGSKHLLAHSKPALLLPSQLARVPCWVCTPSSPETKCIKHTVRMGSASPGSRAWLSAIPQLWNLAEK